MSSSAAPPETPAFDAPKAIEWRGIRLEPHSPGVWLSSDRLWKITRIAGDPRAVAFLQLGLELSIVDSGDTAEAALDALAIQATAVTEKLTGALRQATSLVHVEGDVISGAQIKAARIAAALSVSALAWRLDMSPSMLEYLERESQPTLGHRGWLKLSEALPSLIPPKLVEALEAAIRGSEST